MKQTVETVETLRPEIRLNALDTTKVDKANIIDGFCDCVSIPLVAAENEKLLYEFMFGCLMDQYVNSNGKDDTIKNQMINLDLIVDDNSGKRKYYVGSEIQIQDEEPVYESVEIYPTIEEQATVELALLKITNPEQFLLKYSRCRIANLDEVKDKLGFVMDEIDTAQDLYKSTWISPDYKVIAIGCIPNVHNENSKVQFIKVGA